jgi:hypothetical protein
VRNAYDITVDPDGRLVVRCERVGEDEAALASPACLRAVLAALRDHPRVSGVEIVHDREKAYGPQAREGLEALLSLARLLEQLAQRAPAPDFPGFTAKEVRALCAKCEFRPATMFAALVDRLLGDPRAFVESLRTTTKNLDAYDEEGCRACVAATVQDLAVLVDEIAKGAEA